MKIFEVTESTVPTPAMSLRDQVKAEIAKCRDPQNRDPDARALATALTQLVQQMPRELTTLPQVMARAGKMVSANPAPTATPSPVAVANTNVPADGTGVKATVKKSARRGKSAFQKGQELGRRVVAATKTTRRPKTRRF